MLEENKESTKVEKAEELTEEEKAFQEEGFKPSGEPKKIIRSREWMLTIPAYSVEGTEEVQEKLKPYRWAGQLERGESSTEKNEQGYLHYQIGLFGKQAIRNTTLFHLFPKAHREVRKRSKQKMYNYITKSHTRVDGPWFNGDWHDKDLVLKASRRSDLIDLQDAINDGASPNEILADDYLGIKAAHYLSWIEKVYAAKTFEPYRTKDREVTVEYIWGAPGSGKTRYAMSGDRSKIYVATLTSDSSTSSWGHAFDSYGGQPILVLDDFYYWSLPLDYLLRLLDRYPLELDARYFNRIACWSKIIITSNFKLEDQYPGIKEVQRKALERRINVVRELTLNKKENNNE